MRIVLLANFVSPTSGGIRRVVDRLRAGYAAMGHQPTLVVPGPRDRLTWTPAGRVVELASPTLPRSGGYRVVADVPRLWRVLDRLAPDRVEVHDRFTLRTAARWARRRGVPAVVVVHERLDRLADLWAPWPLRPAPHVLRDNARLATRFDHVVVPSRWAAEEFHHAGMTAVEVVGWGVDLDEFRPARRSEVLRRRLLAGADVLLVQTCRLSPEKRPHTAFPALATLRAHGVDARLVVAGTGAAERRTRRLARDLPVTFLGHLEGRRHLAELLASADVAICPGPVETFGLAALEALACGTPVVAVESGAVGELLDDPHGCAVHPHPRALAAAVRRLLAAGPAARRAARAAAEPHTWSRAVSRMAALHGLPAPTPVAAGRRGPAR